MRRWRLGPWPRTVTRWRAGSRGVGWRFWLTGRVTTGAAANITDEQIKAVIVKALRQAPANDDTLIGLMTGSGAVREAPDDAGRTPRADHDHTRTGEDRR